MRVSHGSHFGYPSPGDSIKRDDMLDPVPGTHLVLGGGWTRPGGTLILSSNIACFIRIISPRNLYLWLAGPYFILVHRMSSGNVTLEPAAVVLIDARGHQMNRAVDSGLVLRITRPDPVGWVFGVVKYPIGAFSSSRMAAMWWTWKPTWDGGGDETRRAPFPALILPTFGSATALLDPPESLPCVRRLSASRSPSRRSKSIKFVTIPSGALSCAATVLALA